MLFRSWCASAALGVQDPRLGDRGLSVSVDQEFGVQSPASVWRTRAIQSTTGEEMPASKRRAADSALDTQGSFSSKRARRETTPQIASEHAPQAIRLITCELDAKAAGQPDAKSAAQPDKVLLKLQDQQRNRYAANIATRHESAVFAVAAASTREKFAE